MQNNKNVLYKKKKIMYFMPLNGTLKHSQDGAFYVVCILPQLKNFSSYLWSNKSGSWDFPGGPVVKTPSSSAGGRGLFSGQGAKLPRAPTREHCFMRQ